MAVAFDAASSKDKLAADSADPQTFTHTPSGTPRGVIVVAEHGSNATDSVAGVTYGGQALTRIRIDTDSAGEAGNTYAYFLGTGIPTGAQTVSVDLSANTGTRWVFACVTLTASDDTEVILDDGLGADQSNPSVAFAYGSKTALAVAILYSGLANAATGFTENGNCTRILGVDQGNFGGVAFRQTTPSSGDFTIGGTSASDDVAFSAVAVSEVVAVTFTDAEIAAIQTSHWDPDHSLPISAEEHTTTLDIAWMDIFPPLAAEYAVQTEPPQFWEQLYAEEQSSEDFQQSTLDVSWMDIFEPVLADDFYVATVYVFEFEALFPDRTDFTEEIAGAVLTNADIGGVSAPNYTFTNSFQGGTHETTITVGNSGGASGDAFTTVAAAAADNRLVFSSDEQLLSTQLGADLRFQRPSGVDTMGTEWTFPTPQNRLFARGYFWFSGFNTTSRVLLRVQEGTGGEFAGIGIQSNGVLVLENINGANIDFSPAAPFEKWFRVEVMYERNAGESAGDDGRFEWRVYFDPNSSTPDHQLSIAVTGSGDNDYTLVQPFWWTLTSEDVDLFVDEVAYTTLDWLGPSGTTFQTGEQPSVITNHYTGITPEYPWEGIDEWQEPVQLNDPSWLFEPVAPTDDSYIAALDIFPDLEVFFPPEYEAPPFTYDSEIVTNDGPLFDLQAVLDIFPDLETFFPPIHAELPQTYEAEILLNDGPLFADGLVPVLHPTNDGATWPPHDWTNDQPLVDGALEAFIAGEAPVVGFLELIAAQPPEDTAQFPVEPPWPPEVVPETIFFFGTEPPELLGAQLAEDTASHETPWWSPQVDIETVLLEAPAVDAFLIAVQVVEHDANHEPGWWDPQAELATILLEAPAPPIDPALLAAAELFPTVDWPEPEPLVPELVAVGIESLFAGATIPVLPSGDGSDRRRKLKRQMVNTARVRPRRRV